jgi:lipoyl synthase
MTGIHPTGPTNRLPPWIKVRPPGGESYARIKGLLRGLDLHTVCEEARCPNVGECWGGGTATFMLMGDTCTRACRFCAVNTGNPKGWLDAMEPYKIARSLGELKLTYAVITSVDRDDLPDGGAAHFAKTIVESKRAHPETLLEVLIPDFQGDEVSVQKIIEARPDVIAHNVETVRRLSPSVRDRRADYDQSLRVLSFIKRQNPAQYTKSSLMLGLGETDEELDEAFRDLRQAGVDVLTLGQYLRPSDWHLPVVDYVKPERFDTLRERAESYGFLYVASGPLVRSSYRAGEFFLDGVLRRSRSAATAPA